MNCIDCHSSLEANARFCRSCGRPVTPDDFLQSEQPAVVDESSPTALIGPAQVPQAPQQQLWLRAASPPVPSEAPPQSVSPSYQPTQPVVAGTMPSIVQGPHARTLSTGNTRPRRRGRRFLLSLLVLIALLLALWFLGLRPLLHTFAQNQVDQLLSSAVNQLPANASLAPAGIMVVRDNEINNLITLNSAPSDPLQHTQVHITPNGVRIDFQVYGFPCTVTGLPQIINGPLHGQLVVTNVKVEGIVALIMSPDEVTSLVNRHLADAQARLKHPVLGLSLKDQELDLLLGPSIASRL